MIKNLVMLKKATAPSYLNKLIVQLYILLIMQKEKLLIDAPLLFGVKL